MMLMHARTLLLFVREHAAWPPGDADGVGATTWLKCERPAAFGAEAQRLGDRAAVCAELEQVCVRAHVRQREGLRARACACARVRDACLCVRAWAG
jgi:hypothetical protein